MQLDTAVLQFQNLKLSQKLEAQQVESSILEDKLSQIKDKQLPYTSTLKTVHKSWDKVTLILLSFLISLESAVCLLKRSN